MQTKKGYNVVFKGDFVYIPLIVKGVKFLLKLCKKDRLNELLGFNVIENEAYFILTASLIMRAYDIASQLTSEYIEQPGKLKQHLNKMRKKEGESQVYWDYVNFWIERIENNGTK